MIRKAISVFALALVVFTASCDRFRSTEVFTPEKNLKEALFHIRHAINQYTNDKQKEPKSLNDLVQAGYLKSIPTDPMTSRNDTWQTEFDSAGGGIMDVHSGAKGAGTNKVPYAQW